MVREAHIRIECCACESRTVEKEERGTTKTIFTSMKKSS